jgi:hypothetical protein
MPKTGITLQAALNADKERDTKLNIHQRLHAVMQDVSYVQKSHEIKMSGGGYKVVTHDAVTAAVRPALVKHGVVYYPQNLKYEQNGNRTELSLDLRFVNIDHPDDWIDVPTFGYGICSQDKGPGKSLSYGVKMALLKALGLETGEDADLSVAEHEVELITEAQAEEIFGLMKESKAEQKKFLKYLGVEFLDKIPASKYNQAIQALKSKIAKAESNENT